jgi:hypothetical protein
LRAVAAFAVEIIEGEREFALTIVQRSKRLSKIEEVRRSVDEEDRNLTVGMSLRMLQSLNVERGKNNPRGC